MAKLTKTLLLLFLGSFFQNCVNVQEEVNFETNSKGNLSISIDFLEGIEDLAKGLDVDTTKQDSTQGERIQNPSENQSVKDSTSSFTRQVSKTVVQYAEVCSHIKGISNIKIDTSLFNNRITMNFSNPVALNKSMNEFLLLADNIFTFPDSIKASKPKQLIEFYKINKNKIYRSDQTILSYLIDEKKLMKNETIALSEMMMKDCKYKISIRTPSKITSVTNTNSNIKYDMKSLWWENSLMDVLKHRSHIENDIEFTSGK